MLKWLICSSFCLLIACAQVPAAGGKSAISNVPVTLLFSGNQCPCEQNTIKVQQFSRQNEITAFVAQNNNRTIGMSKPEVTPLNFFQDVVLAIWMGRQPTAGYGLALAEHTAQIKEKTVIIRLKVTTPAPNHSVAQVVTSPCILVKLPKGQFDSVTLVSQNGQELAKLNLL